MVAAARRERVPRLPDPRTQLVGRESESAEVLALLARSDLPIVTLTGPGGVGKTRLALHVAKQATHLFNDGVAFMALASIRDSSLVLPTIARAVGIPETGDHRLTQRVRQALADQSMLMIIDNFEHVLDAAPLLANLLEDAPHVTLLCTSRARLKLSFECVYPVAPIAVATAPAAKGSDELARSDAVRLFALRASSARCDFVIDCANIEAVADICRRLDGLPLAIELAAARSNTLPPAALRERLQHPESVLQDVASDRPDRQKTMRDTVAWSYLLLSPNEQQFFRTMTVFSRGFSLVAAAAVWESAEAKDCQRGPVPERMVINAADVVNKVETLEIVDGVMQAPTGPNVVSWYKETARLGESNNMVMAAHVNWWNVPEGVFFHLQNLEEGERVEITGQDGKTYVYEVEWVRQESNLAAPDPHVVGPTDVPSLTMITCGGEWDPTISEYNERTVARAVQVEVIDADRDMPDIGESRTSMMLAA